MGPLLRLGSMASGCKVGRPAFYIYISQRSVIGKEKGLILTVKSSALFHVLGCLSRRRHDRPDAMT